MDSHTSETRSPRSNYFPEALHLAGQGDCLLIVSSHGHGFVYQHSCASWYKFSLLCSQNLKRPTLKASLKGVRRAEIGRKSFPSPGLLSRWPQQLELGYPKAKRQSVIWVSDIGTQILRAVFFCFPRCLIMELSQKQSCQNVNWYLHGTPVSRVAS